MIRNCNVVPVNGKEKRQRLLISAPFENKKIILTCWWTCPDFQVGFVLTKGCNRCHLPQINYHQDASGVLLGSTAMTMMVFFLIAWLVVLFFFAQYQVYSFRQVGMVYVAFYLWLLIEIKWTLSFQHLQGSNIFHKCSFREINLFLLSPPPNSNYILQILWYFLQELKNFAIKMR